jgi:hypothetical protein
MARLNLRKVPDELHRALKSQAGFLGITLEERCLSLLSYGAAVQNWDGGKGKTGAVLKTALPEKNRESSEVPAQGPGQGFDVTGNVSFPEHVPRRAGKSPIKVRKGEALRDVLTMSAEQRAQATITPLPGAVDKVLGGIEKSGQERRSGGTRPRGLSDKGIDRLVAAANAQRLLGDKASPATARSLADHALSEKSGEVPAWVGGNRDIDPSNPEDVAAWQERDRQAASLLSPESGDFTVFQVPDRWPWDGQHFASPNPGPHLLKDKHGNTAYCRPDSCKFCAEGVPPSGDHQAVAVDEIDVRDYAAVEIRKEMSIEEAKRRFPGVEDLLDGKLKVNTDGPGTVIVGKDIPTETVKRIHGRIFPGWSKERLKELADAESAALDATGGLLAVSPEILAEMLIKNNNTSPASPTPDWGSTLADMQSTAVEKWEQFQKEINEKATDIKRFAPEKSGSLSRDPQAGVQHGSQSGGKDAEGKEVARAVGTGSGNDQTKIAALKKIPGVTAAAKITARKCPTHAKSLKAFGPTKLKCPDCSYMEAR